MLCSYWGYKKDPPPKLSQTVTFPLRCTSPIFPSKFQPFLYALKFVRVTFATVEPDGFSTPPILHSCSPLTWLHFLTSTAVALREGRELGWWSGGTGPPLLAIFYSFFARLNYSYVRVLMSFRLFLFPIFLFAAQPRQFFLDGLKKL
jgi:hypothetical protein